jgi:hypothetical protein
MKKIINSILRPFKLELQPLSVRWQRDAFAELYASLDLRTEKEGEYSADAIVFSKDRALQLHALLASYGEKVAAPVPLHVLYQTSNRSHTKAYDELIEIFKQPNITFVKQHSTGSFRNDLIEKLSSIQSEKILFLVDDIIFVEDLNMNDFIRFNTFKFVPTLRMGVHLEECYPLKKKQPLPYWTTGELDSGDKVCWEWKSGIYDWGYPLSVDGHLFSTQEIFAISKLIEFKAPNTFEDGLQKFADLFLPRLGVCYRKSKIINIPCNKVQLENNNICGNISHDFLLEQWEKGMQMNYKKLYGFLNKSAHQEITFELIRR